MLDPVRGASPRCRPWEGIQIMSFKVATWFNTRQAASIVGLAFLWPCLQSSGFYPLSLISSIGDADPAAVAWLHLLYSAELLLAFAGIVAFRGHLEGALRSNKAPCITAGIAGVAGQAALAFGAFDVGQLGPSITIVISLALTALFIAWFVVLWGCRITDASFTHAIFGVALSYLLSQIILVPFALAGLPTGLLLCCCAVATTFCAAYSTKAPEPGAATTPSGSAQTFPWRIVVTTVVLIWFCIVYIRLLIPTCTGDSSIGSKLFAAALCIGTYAVVVCYLAKNPDSKSRFIGVFILLIGAYMLGLLAIAVFSDLNDTMARRIFIASEHCLEAFLWMILCDAVLRNRLSAEVVFSLYGIVVVSLPWVLSFDVRYLANIPEALLADKLLASLAPIALFVVALCTVTFLFQQMRRTIQELTGQASSAQQEIVSESLDGAGLTELELEVAKLVYRGYSAKRIAETLYVSEPSVKNCTSRIYRKLNIHSKQELISYVDDHKGVA